jgi:photosystem II stability/assembly factor-like uncharacterized protein
MTTGRRAVASLSKVGALALALCSCGVPAAGADPVAGNDEVESRQGALTINSWTYTGARGIVYSSTPPQTLLSGQVTDVEKTGGLFRLGAAAGGVFQWTGTWSPISDGLTPTDNPPPNGSTGLSIGAEATHPTMTNIVLAGTGTHAINGGTGIAGSGLWLSTNSGTTWTQALTRAQTGPAVNRISWSTKTPDTVLVGTDNGVWRSTNRGAGWSQVLAAGAVTDIARKSDDSVILAFVSQQNIFSSTNGGASFTINTQALPRSIASTTLAFTGSTVYAAFSDTQGQVTVFKSTNSGSTFNPVTKPVQNPNAPEQCNATQPVALGVSPNGLTVLVGCRNLLRSTDGGTSWPTLVSSSLNPGRFHVVKFVDAATVILGSDSGFHYSNDAGASWHADSNLIPIESLVDFDARIDSPSVFFGATGGGTNVSNIGIGVFRSTDGGASWLGSSVFAQTFDNFNFQAILVDPALGATNAWAVDVTERRFRTVDNGGSWTPIDGAGFPNSPSVQIHHDQVPSVFLYTQGVSGTIRQSIDQGASWTVYPSSSMPSLPGDARSFAVGRWRSGSDSVIYANLNTSPTQLVVLDPAVSTTSWRDITAQFPAAFQANMAFAPSLINTNVAFSFSGNRLWRTASSGVAWEFMSATTPIPSTAVITDIIDNPLNPDMWFVATTVGVFKTIDGGFNWRPWKNGLPAGVPSAVKIHGTATSNPSTFQVVGGFNGRGIWQRDAIGDDS